MRTRSRGVGRERCLLRRVTGSSFLPLPSSLTFSDPLFILPIDQFKHPLWRSRSDVRTATRRSMPPLALDMAFDTAAASGVTDKGPPRRMCRRNVVSPHAIGEISAADALKAALTCPHPTLRALAAPGQIWLPTPPPALTPGVSKRSHRYGCTPGSQCGSLPRGKGVVVSPARVASAHHELRYELRPRVREVRRQRRVSFH